MSITDNITNGMMSSERKIDIGIPEDQRKNISAGLSRLLADSYLLLLKTHNYHWNVTGPLFKSIHEMTEEHYEEIFQAIDEVAERIRALGYKAPGSFSDYQKLSEMQEGNTDIAAEEMLKDLVSDHEILIRTGRAVIEVADEASDEATIDLVTARLEDHEKYAWMLRSFLG